MRNLCRRYPSRSRHRRSGSSFLAPANVTVGATASAGAGVQKIDFFAGSTLIATATSSTASAHVEQRSGWHVFGEGRRD